jgi:phasin family protein
LTKPGPDSKPAKLPGVAPVKAPPAKVVAKESVSAGPKAPLPGAKPAPIKINSETTDAPKVEAAPEIAAKPEIAPVAETPVVPDAFIGEAPPAESTSLPLTPPQPTPSVLTHSAEPDQKGLSFMATIAPQFSSEKVQAMFGDLNERAKSTFEKSSKFGEEFADLAKGNVEAIVASARVAAKGTEQLAQEAADYGKKSLETATTALKSFATVKSPTELFQLQSDYAKSSFDSAVAEASKLSETWMKLVGEIVQPISSRYAVAADKIKSASL